MFIHEQKFEPIQLDAEQTEAGRFYKTPGGLYMSITTALGLQEHKQLILNNWRKSVGAEQAAKIARQSSNRGTNVHTIAEKFLNNDPDYKKGVMPDALAMFVSIRQILIERVTKVYAQECALFSDMYRLAGRCDVVGEYMGEPTIIDFKTARKRRTVKEIHDYFLQTAGYAFMVREMYELTIKQTAIIMAVENEQPLVFVGEVDKYRMDPFFKGRGTANA